jgi:beta-lactamase class A
MARLLEGRRLIRSIGLFGFLFLLNSVCAQTAPGTAAAKQDVLWQKLESTINDVDHNLDGVLGVAILDLGSGKKFLLHADDVFPQASSIKIAVLAELYRQAQGSKLKLTDLYTVQESDLVADSDIMGGLTPGVTRITLRDLATMMVAVSDNSATNVLIDRVGMENVNALMDSLGLAHTRLRRKMMDLKAAGEGRENVSTPAEMMTLLENLYRGKILNQQMTNDFFKMLSTHKESFIPRDLPEGLKVANKPGELEGVRNDSGVVFVENRPYVICVMTTYLRRERDGEQAISRISAAAYNMFDRLARASEYGRVISPGNSSR